MIVMSTGTPCPQSLAKMRVAIAGPDGAGKSSVCKALAEHMQPAEIVYAGKANFRFRSTACALHCWKKLRGRNRLCALLVQHFIYYPFEYIENLYRFLGGKDNGKSYIYDRHPIDRLIMKHSLRLQYDRKKIGLIAYAHQIPLYWVWWIIYKYIFINIDAVLVLLPDKETCFQRAGAQYKDIEDADIRLTAYRLGLEELSSKGVYIPVFVDKMDSISVVRDRVLRELSSRKLYK